MIKLRPIRTNTAKAGYNTDNVYWEDTYDEKTDDTILERKEEREGRALRKQGVYTSKIPGNQVPDGMMTAWKVDPEAVKGTLSWHLYENINNIRPFDYIRSGAVKLESYGYGFTVQYSIFSYLEEPGRWQQSDVGKIYNTPQDLMNAAIENWIADWPKRGLAAGQSLGYRYLKYLAPFWYEDDYMLKRVCKILELGSNRRSAEELFDLVRQRGQTSRTSVPSIMTLTLDEGDINEVWEKVGYLKNIVYSPDIKLAIYKETGEEL